VTVTLNLDSQIEKALRARAHERGLSLDDLLLEVVEREAMVSSLPSPSGSEKARAFVEWADSFPDTPPLPDDAISRASMYPDRW
jgi:hypothetical protein